MVCLPKKGLQQEFYILVSTGNLMRQAKRDNPIIKTTQEKSVSTCD